MRSWTMRGRRRGVAPHAPLAFNRAFGADHTLFGSDSPWGGQAETLKALDRLGLTEKEKKRILCSNALNLLGLRQEERPVQERN